MKKNKLYIFTWVSGSWKTSVTNLLPKAKWSTPINFTTRQPRNDGELDEYVFVTDEVFKQLDEQGRLAESITYWTNSYWISKYWYEGLTYAIMEPNGRSILKEQAELWNLCDKHWKEIDVEVVTIYITIDQLTQHTRLTNRWDSVEEITKRAKDFETFAPTDSCVVLDWTIESSLLVKQIEEWVE